MNPSTGACIPGYCTDRTEPIADQVRTGQAATIGEGNAVWSFVHIDDAIAATIASLTAEPGATMSSITIPFPLAECLPALARWVGAAEPPHVSVEGALKSAGEEAVYYAHPPDCSLQQPCECATRLRAAAAPGA